MIFQRLLAAEEIEKKLETLKNDDSSETYDDARNMLQSVAIIKDTYMRDLLCAKVKEKAQIAYTHLTNNGTLIDAMGDSRGIFLDWAKRYTYTIDKEQKQIAAYNMEFIILRDLEQGPTFFYESSKNIYAQLLKEVEEKEEDENKPESIEKAVGYVVECTKSMHPYDTVILLKKWKAIFKYNFALATTRHSKAHKSFLEFASCFGWIISARTIINYS